MKIDEGIINSGTDYFKELLGVGDKELETIVDWDNEFSDSQVSMKEYDAVCDIIALEMSYFCLRRVYNSCGSNVDTIYSILQKKYIQYEKDFGKDFKQLNKGKLA